MVWSFSSPVASSLFELGASLSISFCNPFHFERSEKSKNGLFKACFSFFSLDGCRGWSSSRGANVKARSAERGQKRTLSFVGISSRVAGQDLFPADPSRPHAGTTRVQSLFGGGIGKRDHHFTAYFFHCRLQLMTMFGKDTARKLTPAEVGHLRLLSRRERFGVSCFCIGPENHGQSRIKRFRKWWMHGRFCTTKIELDPIGEKKGEREIFFGIPLSEKIRTRRDEFCFQLDRRMAELLN